MIRWEVADWHPVVEACILHSTIQCSVGGEEVATADSTHPYSYVHLPENMFADVFSFLYRVPPGARYDPIGPGGGPPQGRGGPRFPGRGGGIGGGAPPNPFGGFGGNDFI